MKLVLVIASLLSATVASASIENSTFLPHEQSMIKQAVQDKCGRIGTLSEMLTKTESVDVDNGIRDDYFTTNLELEARLEQNVSEILSVEVKSARYSSYDHTHKVWGSFNVLSVDCNATSSGH